MKVQDRQTASRSKPAKKRTTPNRKATLFGKFPRLADLDLEQINQITNSCCHIPQQKS